ncbi:MAG: AAA family ATPase [Gammaproteobacteria bacterium]|nr:AAA family ATPase [Gammaproteobacteria bacterium]
MNTPDAPVTRIRSLVLENFKGFRDKHELFDLDADIVLLTGPNGHGKSGLLEALTLALTGWHDPELDPARHLISRIPKTDTTESKPEDYARIELRALFGEEIAGEKKAEALPIEWRFESEQTEPTHHSHRPRSRLDPPVPEPAVSDADLDERRRQSDALKARLSTFFQDRLDKLFDETAAGLTLRDIFEPVPPWIADVRTAIDNAQEKLGLAVAERQDDARKPAQALYPTLAGQIAAFKDPYQTLRRETQGESRDEWPPLPENCTPEDTWPAFLQDLAKRNLILAPTGDDTRLTERLEQALLGEQGIIADLIRRAMARRGEATAARDQARLDKLEQCVEAIEDEENDLKRRYPHLQGDLERFMPTQPGQPDALQIFSSLAANAARWARPNGRESGKPARLTEVLARLAAVNPDQAGQCAQALEDWLVPRRQADQRLKTLAAEKKTLQQKIEQLRATVDVQRLRDLRRRLRETLEPLRETWKDILERQDFERRRQQRARAREHLAAATETVAALGTALDQLTAPSKALLQQLRDTANWALGRFSLVPGVAPLRLEPKENSDGRRSYQVLTQDGRELRQLSTGQRAQFGIALLLAQNREVSEYLGHRALFLDDVSTAYDLSNLTREALLWRQLAYGAKPPFKRQIFLSSHHEDLTSQLLDLLVPPAGASMRLIRLHGWQPDSGPELDNFRVEPTAHSAPGSDAVRQFIDSIEQEKYLWQSG